MIRVALVLLVSMLFATAASGADSPGYKKAYFGATKPGSWAQYTMKVEGQADMGYLSTRLSDEAGKQRVQVRVEYMASGKLTQAFTNYSMKTGYSLESDALGFGKALVSMSTSTPGTPPYVMPAAAVDSARKTMPDYAASAQFVGTENIGGKLSDRYKYTQRYPGTPAQIETGEIWLNDSVPFGMVKQKAVTKEESGKVVSQFEMLLIDSGVNAAIAQETGTKPDKRAATGPVLLSDAFKNGRVELGVSVLGGPGEGKNLRISFKNKGTTPLRLTIPAGQTTLDVGLPLDKLRLEASAAKSIDIGPGATSAAVEILQTGTRRAVSGSFVLSVYEGTPLYSGNAIVGTVKSR